MNEPESVVAPLASRKAFGVARLDDEATAWHWHAAQSRIEHRDVADDSEFESLASAADMESGEQARCDPCVGLTQCTRSG